MLFDKWNICIKLCQNSKLCPNARWALVEEDTWSEVHIKDVTEGLLWREEIQEEFSHLGTREEDSSEKDKGRPNSKLLSLMMIY